MCQLLSVNPIPLIHLTNVQVLQLYVNEITLLEKDSFVSMTELLLLHVSRCGLRTIELGAFNGLTKLTQLSMWDNKISDILPGTFENMKSLEYLDLNRNKIENLDSAVFSGLFNLKYIRLSANKLQYLHPDTFLGLPNTKDLYLEKSGSLQIPTDRNFINSHSSSFLGFSYSNISSVSVETFANVCALERLDLSYNNLRNIDINLLRTLPELSELYLYGNPLQCDCRLQEVWRWCKDHNIKTAYRIWAPQCETPRKVKGIWWGLLDKGQCLGGKLKYFWDYKIIRYSESDTGEYKYDYADNYDSKVLKHYQLPVYVVPFIFGTTANVILLIIIICNNDMRTVPNMYILNLAISDIIYLTVFFYEACANRITITWVNDEFTCMFFPFCRRMSVGLSAYSVALYSFQRYRVIVNPFLVPLSSQPKWRGIVATFCGVWLVAALFAVPSALSMNLCGYFFGVILITYYQHVVILELLVSCVLPLCVIAFCYIMTSRHLVESSRAISEGTQNPQLKKRRNAAKIVLGLAVVFVISYVPYHVFWTYYICSQVQISSSDFNHIFYFPSPNIRNILNDSNYEFQYMYLISTCFLSINSCLNPVAMFYTSSQFRHHLKRYLNFIKNHFLQNN